MRLAIVFLALWMLGSAGPARAEHAELPNIIFILVDDQRWDHMGNMGHPFLETPHMDRLASEGIRFNNAFVTTSLCSPSRASFLTGQYAHTHGVQNNFTPWRNENVTFIEGLKEVGYDTAFIGKWHMPGRLPELRGVDEFVTFTVRGGQGQYFSCPLVVNGKPEPSRKPYITEELTDRALEFMARDRDAPFFVYLSHKAVHHDFLPPPELKGRYDGVDLGLPPEADSWIAWFNGLVWSGILGRFERSYQGYCESLVAVDQQLGRVLDWLDEEGLADDTLVVLAGDNGYFWGEHRLVDKRWPYEESIRIPLLVRYPSRIVPGGRDSDAMVLNIDLAPTLLEVAGAPVPGSMEGQSLVPFFEEPSAAGREAWLYEYFEDFPYNIPALRAVRTKTHKLIRYEGRRPDELYDLTRDPGERNDLVGTPEGAELHRELSATLDRLIVGEQP